MYRTIKSFIIIRKIFYMLRNKKLCKIINYNKNLQITLNIDLLYYQNISKKVILYENKTEGFEYNAINEDLLYKGSFLNGKRNGKGIEYDYLNQIVFKGNFLNGKRNGKGTEYNNKGQQIFKGEYLNGERNGKGKEYIYLNIYIIEEDEDNNEQRLKELENILYKFKIFVGEYKDNKRWNGKCREFDKYGVLYELTEYKNGVELKEEREKLNKEGEKLKNETEEENSENLNISDIKRYDYKGIPIVNELFNGRGKEYRGKSIIYEGEFKEGKRDGLGKEYYNEVLVFEGKFKNGERNGKGSEFWSNDQLMSEFIFKDKYVNLENYSKLRFIGNYINGEKNGIGEEYDVYGNLIFQGEYLNNKRWKGKGIEYYNDNILFEGEYLMDKNGMVKERNIIMAN